MAHGRRPQRLHHPSGGVGSHHDPLRTRPAHGMPAAAGQHAQLGSQPGCAPAPEVAGPRGAPARIGRPGERAKPGIGCGAAVLEARPREVDDATAARAQALEPLLLVAVGAHDALVEGADALERRAAHGEVRSPDHVGVMVVGPEVEHRDGGLLSSARARSAALEARPDRSAEGLGLLMGPGSVDQRAQPVPGHEHVVIDERDQRSAGLAHAGVARRVEAARLAMVHAAHAVARRDPGGGVVRAVVDHEDLVRGIASLAPERAQRHIEIAGTVARGYHDRDLRIAHSGRRLHGHGVYLPSQHEPGPDPRQRIEGPARKQAKERAVVTRPGVRHHAALAHL